MVTELLWYHCCKYRARFHINIYTIFTIVSDHIHRINYSAVHNFKTMAKRAAVHRVQVTEFTYSVYNNSSRTPSDGLCWAGFCSKSMLHCQQNPTHCFPQELMLNTISLLLSETAPKPGISALQVAPTPTKSSKPALKDTTNPQGTKRERDQSKTSGQPPKQPKTSNFAYTFDLAYPVILVSDAPYVLGILKYFFQRENSIIKHARNTQHGSVIIKQVFSADALEREVRVHLRLLPYHYPNIVPLLDVVRDTDESFYAMVFPTGSSPLRSIMSHLSAQDIAFAMQGLLTGLSDISKQQIVYMDINPSNLLWDAKACRLSIIDLGISQFLDVFPHEVCGTDGMTHKNSAPLSLMVLIF